MKLNIHSIIDVITNSSTEIYTYVTKDGVEKAHEMINEILKVSGSTAKSEDLFDISIVPSDWDRITERLYDDPESYEYCVDVDVVEKFYTDIQSLDYKGVRKYEEKHVIPYLMDENKWEEMKIEELATSLQITPKDKSKSDKDIWQLFFNLFDQEAEYAN
jgi:hypothetical protein